MMNLKKLFLMGALCTIVLSAYAGVVSTTVHSRANCVNNESITWWLFHPFDWKVVSIHDFKNTSYHIVDTGFSYTWRAAGVHWNEACPTQSNWTVSGFHYLLSYGNGRIPFDRTFAKDCSIYNGWWDH